ncbi:MAG: lecithin retinol acyltransferase family protein [Treponema sp.]|nr:lecithin retinol acyltransferase family protein [Treponema sp.]
MSRIENKPMPGDVLSVNRGLYRHYGVYVGNGTVVHFSGGEGHELSARMACIRKTTVESFRKNGEIQIETRCCKSYSRKETVMRALGAVGTEKGKYSLQWNNCEHFANWCRYGEKRSLQVEQFVNKIGGLGLLSVSSLLAGCIADELEDI